MAFPSIREIIKSYSSRLSFISHKLVDGFCTKEVKYRSNIPISCNPLFLILFLILSISQPFFFHRNRVCSLTFLVGHFACVQRMKCRWNIMDCAPMECSIHISSILFKIINWPIKIFIRYATIIAISFLCGFVGMSVSKCLLVITFMQLWMVNNFGARCISTTMRRVNDIKVIK